MRTFFSRDNVRISRTDRLYWPDLRLTNTCLKWGKIPPLAYHCAFTLPDSWVGSLKGRSIVIGL